MADYPLAIQVTGNVKRVPINVSSSGDTVLVAAVANKQVKVIEFIPVADDEVVIKLQDTDNTALTGPMNLAVAGNGFLAAHCGQSFTPVVHFITEPGKGLEINLSDAVQVGGWMIYVQE